MVMEMFCVLTLSRSLSWFRSGTITLQDVTSWGKQMKIHRISLYSCVITAYESTVISNENAYLEQNPLPDFRLKSKASLWPFPAAFISYFSLTHVTRHAATGASYCSWTCLASSHRRALMQQFPLIHRGTFQTPNGSLNCGQYQTLYMLCFSMYKVLFVN